MTIFMVGLNRELSNVVELHHYVTLQVIVHTTMKLEKQLKMRTSEFGPIPQMTSASPWRSRFSGKEKFTFDTTKLKLMVGAVATTKAFKSSKNATSTLSRDIILDERIERIVMKSFEDQYKGLTYKQHPTYYKLEF